jgi:TonB family protein
MTMLFISGRRLTTAGLIVAAVLHSTSVYAQEPLTRAKAAYASAAYEDALVALSSVRYTAPSTEATEVAAYKAFCLLALGRTDEARSAVEALVQIDPLYRPTDEQASPRVRTFFHEVRQPLLPEIARQAYANARAAYDRKDLTVASSAFERALTLIDDIDAAGNSSVGDLRTLAAGFKELIDLAVVRAEEEAREAADAEAARLEAVAEKARKEAAATAAAAEAARLEELNRVYTDADAAIVRPDVVSRNMPPWSAPTGADSGQEFSGVLEVVIDKAGKVESAEMRESVHPLYDSLLIRATKGWKFKPATKDGTAVRYLYRMGIRVGR